MKLYEHADFRQLIVRVANERKVAEENRVLFGSPDAKTVLAWVEKNHGNDIDLVTKLPGEGAPRRWAF